MMEGGIDRERDERGIVTKGVRNMADGWK